MAVLNLAMFPELGEPLDVTVPVPAGVAHVQSPRRNVVDDGVPVQLDALTVLNVPPPAAFEWLWVAFVKLAMVGVNNVGVLLKTDNPVPVSSDKTPANCAEVVAANCDSGLAVNPRPEGKSPSTSAQGANVVVVPHVPMTRCDVCPVVGASVTAGVVVAVATVHVNHDGPEPEKVDTVPPADPPLTVHTPPAQVMICPADR